MRYINLKIDIDIDIDIETDIDILSALTRCSGDINIFIKWHTAH